MKEQVQAMFFPQETVERAALWRASSLHKCLRLQLLEARGINVEPLSAQQQRMLAVRSAIHKQYQEALLHQFGIVTSEKVYIDHELHVGGHVDAILPKCSPPVLIELKTLNPFVFHKYAEGKLEPYWNLQIDFYYEQVRAVEGFEDLDLQVHLFNVATGEIAFMQPHKEDYRPVAEALNLYWLSGLLPPPQDNCNKCPLTHICTEPLETIDQFVEAIKNWRYSVEE